MNSLYASGQAPWDSGVASAELIRVVEEHGLSGKTLLEFGCGTGTNAIELARRGYKVTAIDLANVAIDRAIQKAADAKVKIEFRNGDLTETELGGPYDCLFDLGVYHGMRNRGLPAFLATLRRVSRPGTRWLSLAGNAREPLSNGPPVVSEAEIRSDLEADFRVVQLREFRFNLAPDFQPLAWSILLERR